VLDLHVAQENPRRIDAEWGRYVGRSVGTGVALFGCRRLCRLRHRVTTGQDSEHHPSRDQGSRMLQCLPSNEIRSSVTVFEPSCISLFSSTPLASTVPSIFAGPKEERTFRCSFDCIS